MDREKLEKIINVLNEAIENDTSWKIEGELYDILKDKIAFFIPESLNDDYPIDDEVMENFIKLLKYIKLQLKDEEKKFFEENLNQKVRIFIQDDETKLKMLPEFSDEYDYDFKNRIMGFRLNNKRTRVICSMDNDDLKMSLLDDIGDDINKSKVIRSFNSEVNQVKALSKLDYLSQLVVIRQLSTNTILKHIEEIFKMYGITNDIQEKVEKLKDLASRNSELFCHFEAPHLKLLEEKYENFLTKRQMDLVMLYPDMQEKLIELGEDTKKLELIKKIIQLNPIEDDQQFQIQFQRILKRVAADKKSNIFGRKDKDGYYDELIESIDIEQLTDTDAKILSNILQQPNLFSIKTIEDVRNFETIIQSVYNVIIEGNTETLRKYPNLEFFNETSLLKLVVLEKLYGQDLDISKEIVRKYGEDIDNLPDMEIETQYVKSLKDILNAVDEKLLAMFYNIDISLEKEDINPVLMEVNLKHIYGKQFNKGLLKIEGLEKEDGIYKAGTNFKMLITSVEAYDNASYSFLDNYNFEKAWNRNSIVSQGFCCSYITNDMMGTAPIRNFCYGFSEMAEDSLMLSGDGDIFSEARKFNPSAEKEEIYYTPEEQINNTKEYSEYYYNEMVFKRFQNGERKQPDYIVLFKNGDTIDGLEKAQKAAKQWENAGIHIPIVVIDVDECIEYNRAILEEMIEGCKSLEDLKMIKQKLENNKKTRSEPFEDIEKRITELENKYYEKNETSKIGKNVLKSAIEVTENVTRIGIIYEQIQNIKKLQKMKTEEKGQSKGDRS